MQNPMGELFPDDVPGAAFNFHGYAYDDIDTASQRIVVANAVDHRALATDERRSKHVIDEQLASLPVSPLPPLDWPLAPATEVSKDGNARCVTKFVPTPPEHRPSQIRPSHRVHLKRTVEIFPETGEEEITLQAHVRKREYIKVMAQDFHQYANDIDELRRRQVVPQSSPVENKIIETSYKSRYRQRCEMPAEQRDEWSHVSDAPQWGNTDEAGLHQVWMPPTPVAKVQQEQRSVISGTRVARSNSPSARASEAKIQRSEHSYGSCPDRSGKADLCSPRNARPSSQGRRSRGTPDGKRGTSAEPNVQTMNRTTRSPVPSSALPPLPRKTATSRL